jgi:protein-S-isoprenylcysteine O-methyltransferase Ste14
MPEKPSTLPTKPRPAVLKWIPLITVIAVCLFFRPQIRAWMAARGGLHLSAPLWAVGASLAPWLLLGIYWEFAARTASEAAASESGLSRQLHVWLLSVAQVLLIFPVPGLQQRFVPLSLAVMITALIVEALGLALAVWARRILGKHWNGKITIKVGHELIRSGPYRLVRHPIYTAVLMIYGGTAVVFGEMHSLLRFVLAVLAYLRKIRLEEANLARGFGEPYEKYRAETKALVPLIY